MKKYRLKKSVVKSFKKIIKEVFYFIIIFYLVLIIISNLLYQFAVRY